MYLGRIVEVGRTPDMIARRVHPYTDALLAAVPRPERAKGFSPMLSGEVPSPIAPPPGCHFHPRCPIAIDACSEAEPSMTEFGLDRRAACIVRAAELESVGLKKGGRMNAKA
jgi:oligopeptide/dipeptide ABC transporter ATP-binding protein